MERDPLFSQHCSKQTIKYKNYGLLTLQVPCSTAGEPFGSQKIVKYDNEKAGTFATAMMVTGTCFRSKANWMTCACYWAVTALVTSLLVWDRQDGFSHVHPLENKLQKEALEDLTKYFTALVAFLIGLFVSIMVKRWWDMRTHLCSLFNSIHDLMSRIATRMRSPENHRFKQRLLRLCLLSTRLVFNEARGEETRADLTVHVDAGLMSLDELDALYRGTDHSDGKPGKPKIVWTWINVLFQTLCKQGKITGLTPPVLARFDGIFADASSAVTKINSYIDTQISFAYVHMLTFVVVANNLLIAIKSGLLIGNCIGPGGYPDNTVVILEVAHVILIPFIYHSFLTMGFELANPFGADEHQCSFPNYAYGIHCREMEIACMEAAEKPPASVMDDLRDLGDLGELGDHLAAMGGPKAGHLDDAIEAGYADDC